MNNCHIGIQARTTSQRLPNKVLMEIANKPIVDHLLFHCFKTMKYINKHAEKSGIYVNYALLIPESDTRLDDLYKGKVRVIKGSENDVLSRYLKLQKETEADYIVRITADCPMLTSAIITKHINVAHINKHDYVANCFEKFRTFFDGQDVEVISKKALLWLAENTNDLEKEHVTLKLRLNPPSWLNVGVVMNQFDESEVKYSVDTQEDFDRVKYKIELGQKKINTAIKLFGKRNVYNFG